MTSPPGTTPTTNRITGTVPNAATKSATAGRILDRARRAGIRLNGAEVRHLMRAYDVPALTDIDLERLICEMPLGLRRPRKVAKRGWAVTST